MITTSILEKLERISIWVTLFLVPLVILPIFPSPFLTGKIALLVLGVLVALLARVARMYMDKSLKVSAGAFDLVAILLAAAYVFSTITVTPNKMEAVLLPGTATLMLFSCILYLLINQFDYKDKQKTKFVLILPAVVISFVALLSFSGVLNGISSFPNYVRSTSFNLAGGSLAALIYLLAMLPLAASLAFKERDAFIKVLSAIAAAIIIMGVIASGYDVYTSGKSTPLMPSLKTSWFVAIDSLKESPLAGVGPGNYLSAYNRYRPISDNATEFWQSRFTSARNFYLTVITETGLIGIAALVFLALTLYALLKRDSKTDKPLSLEMLINDNFLSLVVLVVLLAIFPSFPTTTVLLFALLSLSIKSHKINLGLDSSVSRMPLIVLALPILAFVVYSGYQSVRLLAAEAKYKTTLDAITKNDGKAAYEGLISSINQNPLVDRYHIAYAQVNLLLANNVASKENLTDQDRQTVSNLIQQSIREGKSAVSLNPGRAGNWEVLASIYKNISALAKDADKFALQTYSQAIALDPGNINYRISLGSLQYAAKNYDSAIDTFKLAVLAKPDHANARYNLSIAYRDNNQLDLAIAQMEQVVTLVERDSEDYKVAMKELEDMKAKKPKDADQAGKSLIPPASPAPTIQPQIDLDEEANPPQPVVTPAPSATPLP